MSLDKILTYIQLEGHKRTAYVACSSFLILMIFGISYTEGYRIKERTIMRTGSIEITSSEDESIVYVDGKNKGDTILGEEMVVKSLKPGEYEVAVIKNGFEPWRQDVVLKAGETLELDITLKVSGVASRQVGANK